MWHRCIGLNYLPWSMLLESRKNVYLSTSNRVTFLSLNSRDLICRVYQSVNAEELEIQYSQALAKPKQETILHSNLLEALAFKATRIHRYNPLNRNRNSTTNLVHRTTVHMWRWFNSSDYYFVHLFRTWSCSYESQENCIWVLVWIPNRSRYNINTTIQQNHTQV